MRSITSIFLLLFLLSCKPVLTQSTVQDVGGSEEASESYRSEDVKWIGYFVGFASVQAPLTENEGKVSAGRNGFYTWKTKLADFQRSIANSKCGSVSYNPEFEKFYADRLRRKMGWYQLNEIMSGAGNCESNAADIADFLRNMRSKRGAELHELHTLFLLDRFSDMFFMNKVRDIANLTFNEMPAAIFTDKTSPSLDFNNEVASIIAQPKTWEELGMSPNMGLMAYYGGKFIYQNKDSILFQLSPLGALYAVGESWMDLVEGRDAQGKSISRVKAGAWLALNVAIATGEAFAIKVGSVKVMGKAVQASNRIASKAKSLRSKVLDGTLSKDEVLDYQRLVKSEIDSLSSAKKVVTTIDDAAVITIKGKKMLNLAKSIPGFKDDVFLGIEKGHAMLIVKGRRVDAGPLLKTKVKATSNSLTKDGLFFRLNLDEATKSEIFNNLDVAATKRSWTCSHGACQILNDHGNLVFGQGNLIENFRPSSLARGILDGKLKYKAGANAGKTVDFDIFITKGKTVPNYLASVANVENVVMGLYATALTMVTAKIIAPESDDIEFYSETIFLIVDGEVKF